MAFYKNRINKKTGCFFPYAIPNGGNIGTIELAERISTITNVSKSDAFSVLEELPKVIIDLLKQGKIVQIEGLGKFKLSLVTRAVKNKSELDFQKQVKSVLVKFISQDEENIANEDTPPCVLGGNIEWICVDNDKEENYNTNKK